MMPSKQRTVVVASEPAFHTGKNLGTAHYGRWLYQPGAKLRANVSAFKVKRAAKGSIATLTAGVDGELVDARISGALRDDLANQLAYNCRALGYTLVGDVIFEVQPDLFSSTAEVTAVAFIVKAGHGREGRRLLAPPRLQQTKHAPGKAPRRRRQGR